MWCDFINGLVQAQYGQRLFYVWGPQPHRSCITQSEVLEFDMVLSLSSLVIEYSFATSSPSTLGTTSFFFCSWGRWFINTSGGCFWCDLFLSCCPIYNYFLVLIQYSTHILHWRNELTLFVRKIRILFRSKDQDTLNRILTLMNGLLI